MITTRLHDIIGTASLVGGCIGYFFLFPGATLRDTIIALGVSAFLSAHITLSIFAVTVPARYSKLVSTGNDKVDMNTPKATLAGILYSLITWTILHFCGWLDIKSSPISPYFLKVLLTATFFASLVAYLRLNKTIFSK